jgi:hypothetical protein
LFEEVSLEMVGYQVMREYMSGDYRPRYQFEVIRDIPVWYSLIPNTL